MRAARRRTTSLTRPAVAPEMATPELAPTREALREALPEIALIQNDELRRLTEDAWLLAWKESGIADLADAPLLGGNGCENFFRSF